MSAPTAGQPGLAAFVAFLRQRLERRDDEDHVWLPMSLGFGLIASLAFLVAVFHVEGTIQDDARMFLSWMGRWDDPELLKGDLVADYWYSVSPWLYRAVFRAGWLVGIKPLVFVKILPALLFPLIAYFSYRLLRAMRADPLAAFVATVFVLNVMVRDDIVVSGTPRAFWPLLLLVGLDGLARVRVLQVALAQLLMAGVYPQVALVMAGVIGLSALTPWQRPWIDLGRRRLALVVLAAVATVAGIAPFLLRESQFGPVFTLAEARTIPTFLYGRGRVLGADGSADFLCQTRLGIFAGGCKGLLDPRLYLLVVANGLGPVVLLMRTFRPGPASGARSPLPLYLLVSSLICAALSAAVLFKLHLPSRYASGLLLLPWLATLPVLSDWIRSRLSPQTLIERYSGRTLAIGAGIAALAGVLAVSIVKTGNALPADRELIAAIRSLPKDAVVGGFAEDLNFSPVLTGRSTLFNRELSIAYEKGYYQQVHRRMEIIRDLVLTTDASVLADRMRELPVDALVVTKDTLAQARIPVTFRGFFGAELAEMEARASQNEPTLVARLAPGCTMGVYRDTVMLDAHCLVREAAAAP
ncbi:hypothetical protein GCM10010869_48950 [Mesorhizobium tianshanense]|uniref:Glycosyltransferase RgtA/B/C/D-like domain-containing protein n=1 Tax=Mesorhizobium tianshanense TaxID=39844 RepID=A0A562NT92_9HYPH|nr:hypothetical protein [Mesorhizobium tianshanense]TWI35389.1 hypothetical protein IQ26_03370 [Mesorhizobium tianshanense]GLS39298.1 hypothetical protein GCM10010869_48950 [Mesorhizobium tianshanense]